MPLQCQVRHLNRRNCKQSVYVIRVCLRLTFSKKASVNFKTVAFFQRERQFFCSTFLLFAFSFLSSSDFFFAGKIFFPSLGFEPGVHWMKVPLKVFNWPLGHSATQLTWCYVYHPLLHLNWKLCRIILIINCANYLSKQRIRKVNEQVQWPIL